VWSGVHMNERCCAGKRWNVSDEWIDRYSDRFDLDKSGYIDDDEWEQLIAAAASAKQLTCEQARAMARIHLQETGCTAPVSDELIDQLFADVDTAGTGCINDDRFSTLLRAGCAVLRYPHRCYFGDL
jgi:Ca2+-binding EF-hand superfamily protein